MGGAINDLISSVNRIKQNAITAPDLTRQNILYNVNGGASTNPLLPGYTPGTNASINIGQVTSNGWLYVSMLLSQSSSEEYPAKVRLQFGYITATSVTANRGTIGSTAVWIPVQAGTPLSLTVANTDTATINATSYWITLTHYPNVSL